MDPLINHGSAKKLAGCSVVCLFEWSACLCSAALLIVQHRSAILWAFCRTNRRFVSSFLSHRWTRMLQRMRSRVNDMISATQRMAYTRRSNGRAFQPRTSNPPADRFAVANIAASAASILPSYFSSFLIFSALHARYG